ncbi:hypothetical protein FRC04_006036 [Tulasnella sp. 424]|nr:hypothetical protein FRC04_006036 [Tulasnella sp. 424]KAG8975625.1 hypothetical protein FRC05_005418 [Tulasnella sp. 425]
MTTAPQAFWEDQRTSDYLKQELEFLDAFTAKVVRGNGDWTRHQIHSSTRRFLGVVLTAVDSWKKTVSPITPEDGPEELPEEDPDDCNDSTYQEDWTPTSLYQWAYLNLKSKLADLADDDLRDELVLRTQYYDAELFGCGVQNAYPLAEDLLSPSSSPPSSSPSSPSPESVTSTEPAYIHQMPPELLSEILIRAHNGVLYFPIVISHVDSRFRKIAESTAWLWTTIDVNLPLPMVRMYLENSNTALLDVRINLSDGGGRRNASSRLSAFIAEVAGHRGRIASLSMSSLNPQPVDEVVKIMLTGPGSTYPHLRRLDTGGLHWVSGMWPRLMMEPLKCPVLAPPQVQELYLRGYRSRDWVLGFPEQHTGLKRLYLANNFSLFFSDLIAVLSKLPNLEALTIEDCTTAREQVTTWPTVILPNLTTLEYVTVGDEAITTIQRALITPKLTSLKLWWNFGFKGWLNQAGALVALLEANPQLESLDLCNCVIHQPTWREAFSKAGSLKYLRLRSCELESQDLEPLWLPGVGNDGEGYLLPHLEHLVVENVFDLTTEDIKQIVMHRPSLRSVELRGWDASNITDDVQFLRKSVEDFILETFNGGPNSLDKEEQDEDEDWSSWVTPSEGSLLSGDEEVISRVVGAGGAGNGQPGSLP